MTRTLARFTFAALAAFSVALSASPASAQDSSAGRLVGTVVDQTGNPIKGVKVIARSDTQIGGAKTSYTNDEGTFRFPNLQPGDFEITASAPKLRTVVQKGLKVSINAAANVDVVMEVETTKEEVIKVIDKAPLISTKAANVKEPFDAEFIVNLPLEWRTDVEGFVGHNTPGASWTSNRQARIRGGNQRQSIYTIDGFNSNTMPLTMKSLAAMDVQTASYGADNATTPGGVANLVTKSGSNKFEFDFTGFWEDSYWQLFKQPGETSVHTWNIVANPSFSGPIIKDRLWYYVNLEARNEIRYREADPAGILPKPNRRSYLNGRPTVKLTWQMTPRNTLQNYFTFNRSSFKNDSNPANYTVEAMDGNQFLEWFNGTTWQSVLTDNLIVKAQAGYTRMEGDRRPQSCSDDPVGCIHTPSYVQSQPITYTFNNAPRRRKELNQTVELIGSLEWFASSKRVGEHTVKLKSHFIGKSYDLADTRTGGHMIRFNGSTPDRKTDFYSNDPRFEAGRQDWRLTRTTSSTYTNSLQDSIRATRFVTVNPGVAYVIAEGGTEGFGGQRLKFNGFTPHIAAVWDATHDGRTALRASFNQYVDADLHKRDLGSTPAAFVGGEMVSRECRWSETTQAYDTGCVWAGGAGRRTLGLPCGSDGVRADGTPCSEKLKLPRTWEYTAGAERELIQGVALALDFVYRYYPEPFEDRETNRVWNASGTGLEPTGSYRNGRTETVVDLGTPQGLDRRYVGVTTALHKREGALKVSASYTWAKLNGNADNLENGPWGTNPALDLAYREDGNLPGDRRHEIKSSATYQVNRWFSTGLIYRYQSGTPYNRFFRNDVTGAIEDVRAAVGNNPGGNINDPADDRELRLPDLQTVNVSFRVNFQPLTGQRLEVWTDIINVLALRTPISLQQQDGSAFGSVQTYAEPFRMRLGLRYQF